MSYCPNCGAQNYDNVAVCAGCGSPMNGYNAGAQNNPYMQPVQPEQKSTVYLYDMQQNIPDKYKPLSPWAYFGYSLLFSLPLIGFIMLIVFSFSDDNINRRNFARSYFCALLIFAIIAVVIVVISLITGVSLYNYYNH